MPVVGSIDTRLIILRGNSGSGKSTTARALRDHLGPGVALVEQDHIRRVVLGEHGNGPANAGLIDVMVRYSLDAGYHVILEGIFGSERYGEMLIRLTDDHVGVTSHYYFDLSFAETVRRHATRPLATEVSAAEMREWYRPQDLLGLPGETVITADHQLDEVVKLITGVGLPVAPVLDQASPAVWLT